MVTKLTFQHRKDSPFGRCRAFTLVELLIVITIMVIMIGLTRPALTGMLGSFQITQAGQDVASEITLGRQEAVKRNREVQVRFYQIPPETGAAVPMSSFPYRGMQLWAVDVVGAQAQPKPIDKLRVLPPAVALKYMDGDLSNNARYSPLLDTEPLLTGSDNLPAYNNTQVRWRAIRIRANGLLSPLISGTANNYLTVVRQTDQPASGSPLPANYSLIQVNPATGAVTSYRP